MKKKITGQYIPGGSLLHRMDPRAKFFGFLILTGAVIASNSIVGYSLTVLSVVILGCISRLPIRSVTGVLKRLSVFFIVIFCMNAFFFNSEDPLWHWTIFTLSKEGIFQGLSVVFRVALVIALSNLLTLTTPPMGIMSAIETLVRPLRYLRLPDREIAMILSVAVQFIPTLLEESDVIKKAQTARGARFESKKLRERAMAMLPLIVPLFISAFKKADELATAMEARGYRGAKYRTEKKRSPLDGLAWAGIFVCACICAAEVFII